MTSDIERAARDYARHGWSVIPVEPCGKRPVAAWLKFQRRIAPAEQIGAWFRRWPDANVAIVTGSLTAVVVIDIDARHDGPASLTKLEAVHGPLPETVEGLTGGGGRHLYFEYPGMHVRNRVGIVPGIDVRGDGGCVVAPPSVHPTGRKYQWLPGHGPYERLPARMPAWLLALICDGGIGDMAGGARRRTGARPCPPDSSASC
jgi:hypothetical protein